MTYDNSYPTQPQPPVPQPPQRKPRWPWILAGVVTLLIIFCAVISVIAVSSDNGQNALPIRSAEESAGSASQPPTPEQEWETVYELSGSGNYEEAETFELTGPRVRLKYNITSTQDGTEVFAAYLLAEDHNFDSEGGLPSVMRNEEGEGQVRVDGDSGMQELTPGRYYLEVLAANCEWEITIQEMR